MKKVLIIEDDRITRETITKFLKKKGFNVEMAVNGKDGVDKVDEIKPSLILLDIIMPEMNGFDVFDTLRAKEETKDIPVIFLTNLDDIRRKKELLDRGAVDYIVKSNIDLTDLIAKVSQFC